MFTDCAVVSIFCQQSMGNRGKYSKTSGYRTPPDSFPMMPREKIEELVSNYEALQEHQERLQPDDKYFATLKQTLEEQISTR